jgi:SAM-dependent methyltransferase
MVTIESCPICLRSEFEHYMDCRDFTVSRETFTMVRCKHCKFLFTNPKPERDKIGGYYKSENYVSHSNTNIGLVNKIYKAVRKYTHKKKLKLVNSLSNGRHILDIGCGTGEFLNVCKRAGWYTQGIEPDEEARSFGIKQYDINVQQESAVSSFPPLSFDVITMWHVLEHVYDLRERVIELKRIISSNGTIVIAVPNCSSKDAIYYQSAWAAYDLPRHLYHFKPNDIEKLFGELGMEVVQTLPMKLDSFYVSMLSEKYLTGHSNFIRAILRGFSSNLSARANGRTYSSQIYLIKKAK